MTDEALAHLQLPVPPLAAGAGIIAGCRHIGAGPLGEGTDQRSSRLPGTDPAAIQLDVGLLAQVGLPALQLLADAGQVVGRQGAVAEGELAGRAVGEDLDGINLTQLRQFGADGGQGVGLLVDEQQADMAVEVLGQLAGLLDAGIDDQQLARLGRLRGRPMIRGVSRGGLGILVLMLGGDGGGAIKQNARLQRQHLLLGLEERVGRLVDHGYRIRALVNGVKLCHNLG